MVGDSLALIRSPAANTGTLPRGRAHAVSKTPANVPGKIAIAGFPDDAARLAGNLFGLMCRQACEIGRIDQLLLDCCESSEDRFDFAL